MDVSSEFWSSNSYILFVWTLNVFAISIFQDFSAMSIKSIDILVNGGSIKGLLH